jgi:TolB-like protein/Tfp pilus assembly protein PilF
VRGSVTDARTDIFSLGVILHEMASGRPPFAGDTLADLVASILTRPPECLCDIKPELPRQLWRIVRRCLEKEPERRLQTALDLRNELQDLARELAAGAGGRERSMAVLPFADLSPQKDQEHFCAGIAEEIQAALGRVEGLRVASRISSLRFQGEDLTSRDIGRRLQVDTLLEGSVRKAGERLRITVRLIDVDQGTQLWSEVYDRALADIFAIQDEIAHRVVEALEVTLGPGERASLATTRTRDVAAYECYLRGRSYFYQYRRQGVEDALQMFREAIRRDPGFALAYAGMADCSAFLYMYAARDESHRQEALSSSMRALELDPGLAQAHASHGTALSLLGRHREAEEAFERALRLDPELFEAYYFYARDCFVQGKFERALSLYEQAVRVRPEDYQAPLLMAQLYEDTDRSEDAERSRRRGLEVVAEHLRLHPDDTRAMYLGANAMVALGEIGEGLEWARRALGRDPDEPMLLYNVGCILSMAGRHDEALDTLDRAAANGITQREWFEQDSNLDPIREHPRFRALMERLGI